MPKIGRMSRKQQRIRRVQTLEMESQVRQVCQELAALMNEPISAAPERVRALYARLGACQRALDHLVGARKSDEIVTGIYNEVVKSK